MGNDLIILGKLDIDTKGLIESKNKLEKELHSLLDMQGELLASGRQNSQEFTNLAKKIDTLRLKYDNVTGALSEKVKANAQYIEQQKVLDSALNKTNRTEEECLENNKRLIELRRQLDVNNDNYRENLVLINARIAENSKVINESNDANIRIINTFANLKAQVGSAFSEINILNGGLKGFGERAEAAGGLKNFLVGAFQGITGGIKGMGAAIVANPIGALLQLLAPIISVIIEKLQTFAPLTNALQQAMAGLEPILNLVMVPINAIAKGITWLVEGFTSFIGSMSDSADEAIKLKQAEQELATQKALLASANEKAKQQADELIKKSQDQSLSEKERADAIAQATQVQLNSYKQRKDITNKTFDIERDKLAQSKELSKADLKILEEGDAAKVQSLMKRKNISDEELKAYEDAKVAKMQIADEEEGIMDQQAAAYKALADEYMASSNNQKLSEKQRLDALQKALAVEKQAYKEKSDAVNEAFQNALDNAAENKKISAEEIAQIIKVGNEYQINSLKKRGFSEDEINALKEANRQREKLLAEEVQITQRYDSAKQKIHDDAAAQEQQRRQKVMDDALEKQKQMLSLYVAQNADKAKTLQQQLDYEKEFSRQSLAILQNELKQKKISNLEYQTALANLKQQESARMAEIAAEYGRAELKLYEQQHQSLIKAGVRLTAELAEEEKKRLDSIYQKNLQILQEENNLNAQTIKAKQANNQQLTQEETEFLTGILQLEQQFKDQVVEVDKKVSDDAEAAKQKKRDDEAAARAAETEEKLNLSQNEYDQQLITEDARYQEQLAVFQQRRDDEQITDEEFKALNLKAETEHQNNVNAIQRAALDNKLSLASNGLGSMIAIMGKESAAGKAMAIAQATIDTYKSAVSAYGAMSAIPIVGPALGAAAAAAAVIAGIQNVKKIASTKAPQTPKAEKGALFSIGGNRHSEGGTLFTGADGTQFEAESGELIGVMNRNAARHFMAFNNAFPAGSGSAPNYFANGGLVSRSIAPQPLDTDELAGKIAQANKSIPAPVVAVHDIVSESNSYVRVRQSADF